MALDGRIIKQNLWLMKHSFIRFYEYIWEIHIQKNVIDLKSHVIWTKL